MGYQSRLLKLGDEIFECANYQKNGVCKPEVVDTSNWKYKHGPETGFVGELYGNDGYPRILFTRLNPVWKPDRGWFGTKASVMDFRNNHPESDARQISLRCLKGWKNNNRKYRGKWDAGTVTGHPNNSTKIGNVQRQAPRYGIQAIMEEMVRANVFPFFEDTPLHYCAMNNVVKCAGLGKASNPNNIMFEKCNWYLKELDILEPHIVVTFSNKSDKYIKRKLKNRIITIGDQTWINISGNKKCLYYNFPHPLGQGKHSWTGKGVERFTGPEKKYRKMRQKDKDKFKAGKAGSSTEKLFNYTQHLVNKTEKIKQGL